MTAMVYESHGVARVLQTGAAWILGFLWVLPLIYAFWTAFHSAEYATHFS